MAVEWFYFSEEWVETGGFCAGDLLAQLCRCANEKRVAIGGEEINWAGIDAFDGYTFPAASPPPYGPPLEAVNTGTGPSFSHRELLLALWLHVGQTAQTARVEGSTTWVWVQKGDTSKRYELPEAYWALRGTLPFGDGPYFRERNLWGVTLGVLKGVLDSLEAQGDVSWVITPAGGSVKTKHWDAELTEVSAPAMVFTAYQQPPDSDTGLRPAGNGVWLGESALVRRRDGAGAAAAIDRYDTPAYPVDNTAGTRRLGYLLNTWGNYRPWATSTYWELLENECQPMLYSDEVPAHPVAENEALPRVAAAGVLYKPAWLAGAQAWPEVGLSGSTQTTVGGATAQAWVRHNSTQPRVWITDYDGTILHGRLGQSTLAKPADGITVDSDVSSSFTISHGGAVYGSTVTLAVNWSAIADRAGWTEAVYRSTLTQGGTTLVDVTYSPGGGGSTTVAIAYSGTPITLTVRTRFEGTTVPAYAEETVGGWPKFAITRWWGRMPFKSFVVSGGQVSVSEVADPDPPQGWPARTGVGVTHRGGMSVTV